MKKHILTLFFISMSVFAFQGCQDDVIETYGTYPVSWMPVTTADGENTKPSYTEGLTLELILKFKQFEGNEVNKITLQVANIDETTGMPGEKSSIQEYGSSSFVEVPQEKQFMVDIDFLISEGQYTDKKIQLSAKLETVAGMTQERELATFSVSEYFEHIIEGIEYYYMYDNSYEDSEMAYNTEKSAGYTALTTVMNHSGFDPENSNFQGELGGNISAHNPDWVASYYVSVWPKILAQNVAELHRVYVNESPYYGGYKSLKSTELGTYAEIDAAIENGQAVIVHGDFRGGVGYKHQIILVAQNNNSFMALDPAGKWDQQVNGTYISNESAGVYVKYSKAAVYAAIGADGEVGMHISVDLEDESLTLKE